MSRALEPVADTSGPKLLDIIDAALQSRGGLTPADACALLAPLPAALDALRATGGPVTLPRGTARDTRAAVAALGLASPPRVKAGAPVPFRAPELADGAPPTSASDVYAVAGLLRTAVTGQSPPPWTLATMPPSSEAPVLDSAFGAVVWDGLADDPALRPESPRVLLDTAQAALTEPAPALSTPPAPVADTRRAQLLGAAVAGAFFLGLLLVAIGGEREQQRTPPRMPLLPAALSPPIAAADAKAAYADDMARTMRGLNSRRVVQRERLADARTGTGQSRGSTALGEAYGIAARSAGRAGPPPNVQETHDGIVSAMRLTESGYRQMARAARDADRAAWVRGRDAVRSREALLQRRVQRLRQLGYDVR